MLIESELDYMKVVHYSVKDISKYIWFHNTSEMNKPKTEVWDVLSKSSNDLLGVIKYYAPWRQYCFINEGKPVFSKGCMNDVVKFLEVINKEKTLVGKLIVG